MFYTVESNVLVIWEFIICRKHLILCSKAFDKRRISEHCPKIGENLWCLNAVFITFLFHRAHLFSLFLTKLVFCMKRTNCIFMCAHIWDSLIFFKWISMIFISVSILTSLFRPFYTEVFPFSRIAFLDFKPFQYTCA